MSDRRKVRCKRSHPINLNVQLCSMFNAKEASVLESYDLPGQDGAGTCSPSTQGTPPPLPGHWELSLLAVFNKDGSGQCSGQPRTAQSRICRHRTVYAHIVFISHLVLLSFGMFPQMVYLHSTDCCYIFRFD